jgi:excisionase family DNA binding protein
VFPWCRILPTSFAGYGIAERCLADYYYSMGKGHAEVPAGKLPSASCRADADFASEATIPSWASELLDLSGPSTPAHGGLTLGGAPHPADASPARTGSSSLAFLMTVTEAATALRVSTKTVRRMLDRGELDCVRVGRLVRIRAEDIGHYIGQDTNA